MSQLQQGWADYPMMIKSGDTFEFSIPGTFCAVKQGEKLLLRINGQTSQVEAGQKGRTAGKQFDRVGVTNQSDYDQMVVLVIGFGDYDLNQFTGRIQAVSGIINSVGETLSDDRIKEAVNLAITDANAFDITRGDFVSETPIGWNVSSYGYYSGATIYEGDNGKFFKGALGGAKETVNLSNPDGGTFLTGNIGGNAFAAADGYIYLFGGFFSNKNYVTKCAPDGVIVDQYELTQNTGVSGFSGALVDSDGNCYTINKSQWRLIKFKWGEQPTEIGGVGSGAVIALDVVDNKVYTSNGTTHKEYDATSDTFTDTTGDSNAGRIPSGTTHKYFIIKNNQSLVVDRVDDALKRYQLKTESFKGYGFVTVGKCQPLEILNRDSITKISADVTMTQQGRAVKVEGELIKAVLELYAAKVGGSVPYNYLDYIYGIKGSGLNTFSGDESFQRVGIRDDFSMLSPGTFSLTFSKRLLTQ